MRVHMCIRIIHACADDATVQQRFTYGAPRRGDTARKLRERRIRNSESCGVIGEGGGVQQQAMESPQQRRGTERLPRKQLNQCKAFTDCRRCKCAGQRGQPIYVITRAQ